MRRWWVWRALPVDPGRAWGLLVDPTAWPTWGPSVVEAELDADRLRLGATGTVVTVVGVRLGFEIDAFEDGRRWSWKVGGVPATDHVLEAGPHGTCRVGFGVPWFAPPYLAICRIALGRLAGLTAEEAFPK